MAGTELFQWLEDSFTHHHTVQYEKANIDDRFSDKEKVALTLPFKAYRATGTINGVLLAVIWLDEKDEAITYLDKILEVSSMQFFHTLTAYSFTNQEHSLRKKSDRI
ncbi:hypothetical protein FD723_18715 [Nostoc sp. C052]|uniref:hypothetical protein n=1 Tax=Nostoc sp. C052 TaxID=2576902 RepID=UPI0015C2EFC9|nr:hypothetical protein [Nostoc sp. C052]QLE42253.1 hypothetical protein FD723_18715 [Nostoc sp. C052]